MIKTKKTKNIAQKTIDDIVARWDEITPQELRGMLFNPDAIKPKALVKLDTRTQEEKGYAGPRAQSVHRNQLPISHIYSNYKLRRPNTNACVLKKLHKTGASKVTIVFPTSENYLAEEGYMKQGIKNVIEDHPSVKSLIEALDEQQIPYDFLPLVKLVNSKAVCNSKAIKPLRFWSSERPDINAVHILLDDNLESGATTRGILSHLRAHGIDGDHIACMFVNALYMQSNSTPTAPTEYQMKILAGLRERFPQLAEKADVILQLLGIEQLEALTATELEKIGISGELYRPKTSTPAAKALTDNLKWLLAHRLSDYQAIPEPTPSYVERCRESLGEPVQSR